MRYQTQNVKPYLNILVRRGGPNPYVRLTLVAVLYHMEAEIVKIHRYIGDISLDFFKAPC
jgi:hypothetical protein